MLREVIISILEDGNLNKISLSDEMENFYREYILNVLDSSEENITESDYDSLALYYEDRVLKVFCRPRLSFTQNEQECEDCNGEGKVDGKQCEACNGEGRIPTKGVEEHGYSGKMWIKLNQSTLEPIGYNIDWKNSW